jgi:hypothetical protein
MESAMKPPARQDLTDRDDSRSMGAGDCGADGQLELAGPDASAQQAAQSIDGDRRTLLAT